MGTITKTVSFDEYVLDEIVNCVVFAKLGRQCTPIEFKEMIDTINEEFYDGKSEHLKMLLVVTTPRTRPGVTG